MVNNPQLDNLDFVVGEDKAIDDILSAAEVEPLLASLVAAGAHLAIITGDHGSPLWQAGGLVADDIELCLPITIEGVPGNHLLVRGPAKQRPQLEPLAALTRAALQSLLNNNLKRMLTTEIHTTVVQQSYQTLLETNQRLAASEARYKTLAENLEQTVERRTADLRLAQASLMQREKLAAIGQLAAGMAHEINNPIGFITSNLNTLQRYVTRLRDMLAGYQAAFDTPQPAGHADSLRRQWRALKLDSILADSGQLFSESLDGCARIGKIVADLRAFAHIDEGEQAVVHLNQEIDRILRVLGPRIPEDCAITRHYGTLSGFSCQPAQITQALMNIIVNALQARQEGLHLTIETRQEGNTITLCFIDNGPGIPAEIINRIFEPFFTTMQVGSGIGLGLANAYDVVASYGGTITVASPPGQGARFTVTLPVSEA